MLADIMNVGQAYTKLLANYFDHASDMLDLLHGLGPLEGADEMAVQVSRTSQMEGSTIRTIAQVGIAATF